MPAVVVAAAVVAVVRWRTDWSATPGGGGRVINPPKSLIYDIFADRWRSKNLLKF